MIIYLGPLGGHKVHKWSNFVREAWLIKERWNKRSCLKPPMNADARRCSAPLIGVDRRASAAPYPRRYEVCSLFLSREVVLFWRGSWCLGGEFCYTAFTTKTRSHQELRRSFGCGRMTAPC